MFLRLFNSKNVYSVILIPLVAFLFWMEPLRIPVTLVVAPGEGMMPLYAIFVKFFVGSTIWPVVTGFVLILFNALIISLLSYEFQFLQHRTFLPGILYVSIVSSFPSLQTFHPVYPASLFVLMAVYFIFSTYHRKNEISSTFNASFCLSIGALFYLPVLTLLPLIWIAIFVLQKSDNWRLLVIPADWDHTTLVIVVGFSFRDGSRTILYLFHFFRDEICQQPIYIQYRIFNYHRFYFHVVSFRKYFPHQFGEHPKNEYPQVFYYSLLDAWPHHSFRFSVSLHWLGSYCHIDDAGLFPDLAFLHGRQERILEGVSLLPIHGNSGGKSLAAFRINLRIRGATRQGSRLQSNSRAVPFVS